MSDKDKNQDDLKKVNIDREVLEKGLPDDDNPRHGLTEVDNSMNHRSGNSIVEGGVNEQRGEPPPGYFTEAPGHQGGGQR